MSASLLIGAMLRGSALLVIAWLITRPVLRTSAAARHLTWTVSLVGMLAMPILVATAPRIAVPLNAFAHGGSSWVPPVAARAIESSLDISNPTAQTAIPTSPVVMSKPKSRSESHTATIPRSLWLIVAWAAVAALLVARMLFGLARVTRLARAARSVDDVESKALARRLSAQLGIQRPIGLLIDAGVGVPMTWGVVYPQVLLPLDFLKWDVERRTAVLLHEFAHIKRLDALTQLLAQLVSALFWFNPLVWLASREMRRQREHACDDCVLVCGTKASDYANELLQIARTLSDAPATPSVALAMARRSEFEGRLLAILDPRVIRRAHSRVRTALGCASVAAVTALLATLTPVRHDAYAALPISNFTSVNTPAASPTPPVATQRSLLAIGPAPKPESWAATAGPLALSAARIDTDPPITLSAARTSPIIAKVATPQQSPVDRETLIAVARAAMRITSDYDKAELLVGIASRYDLDADTRRVFAEAVASIVSDYERRRVISAAVVDSLKASPAFRVALLPTLAKFTSSYDRRAAITTLASGQNGTAAETISLLNAAAAMTTDFDKSATLVAIAQSRELTDSSVRDAYLKAAETIQSSFNHSQAIRALVQR